MRQQACWPCRQRKSRCKVEARSGPICLSCLSHGTPCRFPPTKARRRDALRSGSDRHHAAATLRAPSEVRLDADILPRNSAAAPPQHTPIRSTLSATQVDGPEPLHSTGNSENTQRIVGPLFGSDCQVASGIVPSPGDVPRAHARTMWTGQASGLSEPVVFTETRRRPVDLAHHQHERPRSLNIIERLLEPALSVLIDLFMDKANACMPIFGDDDFQRTSSGLIPGKDFSPALLACLYAHAMIFWSSDQFLAGQHKPDHRFIWNLASETLYSELRTNPSIYTVAAILLSVSGRPTTLLLNNAGQLGFAVNIAHAFGLHRDPTTWDIPQNEKGFRMRVWWNLLMHDRWACLAYGIPPRILLKHSDIKIPCVEDFLNKEAMSIGGPRNFVALAELTEVLYAHLDAIHDLQKPRYATYGTLKSKLQDWAESQHGAQRKIILRGSNLSEPGSANLRLAYLSVQFLQARIELEHFKQALSARGTPSILIDYSKALRAGEEVVLFISELEAPQLNDFWLSESGTLISCVMSFLIRMAIETDGAVGVASSKSSALSLATDLASTLKLHKELADWDVGEACLAQHSQVVDKLKEMEQDRPLADFDSEFLNSLMLDGGFLDIMFSA